MASSERSSANGPPKRASELPVHQPPCAARDVIGERFEVEALARSGGMGHVYRTRDLRTGRAVAVKLLHHQGDATEVARFSREAELLAQLDHPGIVAYVAHGVTNAGQLYLAMDWLDGEDLAQRLRREPLTPEQSLQMVRQVAVALQAAHARGVVHRDIKPGNVFLRGGSLGSVCLVDFGVARQSGVMPSLTRAGGLVGTPGYLAPEQAQGLRTVGRPADIFALGCVLFECLTGRPPFAAAHIAAALARVLFETAPSLQQARPDLPDAWAALLADMLAKSPEKRIQSAREVVQRIDALPPVGSVLPVHVVHDHAVGLGDLEQRLVSVVIATPLVAIEDQATLAVDDHEPMLRALAESLRSQGAEVERMGDGALVATLALDEASAVDQALRAVDFARQIRASWPDAMVALATGRAVAASQPSLGEALTRAGDLLPLAATVQRDHPTARILLEDVTAGLVGARLRTVRLGSGISTLHDLAVTADLSQPLLGKATPCLGRESELATLNAALLATCDDGEARAVLVTGQPGVGKSRLMREFLRRAAPTPASLLVLSARGEPGRQGSAVGVLGRALRPLLGVADEPSGLSPQDALCAALADHHSPAEVERVAAFLGELCGVPFDEQTHVRLRGARQDPRLLRDLMADAWLTWLRQAVRTVPVLVLIEDLHWADRASLDLIDLALRDLADLPWMVVGFARPEVAETLPGLWRGRAHELPLRPLGRRPAEQLVLQALGPAASSDVVARIVEQAAGNALFLEELIRAAAAGNADQLPHTVLAMLQGRIARLDPELRRVLRAASVFGPIFPAHGVQALLGPPTLLAETEGWLRELQDHEILDIQRNEAAGVATWRFRHALVRDAAYSLLTEQDLRLGHRLAAAFLEGQGADPVVIAGHWRSGEQPSRAVPWLVRAAEHAYDRDDHATAGSLAAQGLQCAPEGELGGILLAIDVSARVWQWDWEGAVKQLERALAVLPAGGNWWSKAMQTLSTMLAYRGTVDQELAKLCERFLATPPLPDSELAYAICAGNIASSCTQVGLPALGLQMLQCAEAVCGTDEQRYPLVAAWRHLVKCTYLRHTHDDLAPQVEAAGAALRLYVGAGASPMMIGLAQDVLGEVLCRVGECDRGLALIEATLADAKRRHLDYVATHARQALANSLMVAGRAADAEAVARELLTTPGISVGFQAMAGHVIALAQLFAGQLAAAEVEIRSAIERSPHTPIRRLQMTAALVRIQVQQGQVAEACATADQALAELAMWDGGGYGELPLRLAAAHAFLAAQLPEQAAEQAALARAKVLADAAQFTDATARDRYLQQVPLGLEALRGL